MSAGFGLRGMQENHPASCFWQDLDTVILDIHPFFTTLIILSGWFAKNAMATFVSGWVGGNARAGEAWLAYSIPWWLSASYSSPTLDIATRHMARPRFLCLSFVNRYTKWISTTFNIKSGTQIQALTIGVSGYW
jgi:hypothetical protein